MSPSLDELIPRGGWALDPPASPVLDRLWTVLDTEVDEFFRELYQEFGGQTAPDSQMATLWPLERIVNERDCSTVIEGRRYFAIGDVLIESDLLMVCLADAAAPAVLLYAGDEIASSAKRLVEGVFAGRLFQAAAGDADLPTEEPSAEPAPAPESDRPKRSGWWQRTKASFDN